MKSSEQALSEARRQHTEAIVARHVDELFQRLPMLAGLWLRPIAISGAIVLDVEPAKRAAAFERICALVAARCAFHQSVT